MYSAHSCASEASEDALTTAGVVAALTRVDVLCPLSIGAPAAMVPRFAVTGSSVGTGASTATISSKGPLGDEVACDGTDAGRASKGFGRFPVAAAAAPAESSVIAEMPMTTFGFEPRRRVEGGVITAAGSVFAASNAPRNDAITIANVASSSGAPG